MSHLEYFLEIQKSARKVGLKEAVRWLTARWVPVCEEWKSQARSLVTF